MKLSLSFDNNKLNCCMDEDIDVIKVLNSTPVGKSKSRCRYRTNLVFRHYAC